MNDAKWVLKRRRYDGSETVVTQYWEREDAQDDADILNRAYQSDRYYVEPFDPAKAAGFTNNKLVNAIAKEARAV